MSFESSIWGVLAVGVFPLWLAAGVLDYACHRREHIEETTGIVEPALHALEAAQVGLAALLAIFLEPSLAVVAVTAVLVVAHTATGHVDVTWAASRRRIPSVEQLAHALLVGLPIAAWCLVLAIHLWRVTETGVPRGFALRADPLPAWAVAIVLIAGFVIAVLPALLELLRAVRTRRRKAV